MSVVNEFEACSDVVEADAHHRWWRRGGDAALEHAKYCKLMELTRFGHKGWSDAWNTFLSLPHVNLGQCHERFSCNCRLCEIWRATSTWTGTASKLSWELRAWKLPSRQRDGCNLVCYTVRPICENAFLEFCLQSAGRCGLKTWPLGMPRRTELVFARDASGFSRCSRSLLPGHLSSASMGGPTHSLSPHASLSRQVAGWTQQTLLRLISWKASTSGPHETAEKVLSNVWFYTARSS